MAQRVDDPAVDHLLGLESVRSRARVHPVARERRRKESDIGPLRHPQPQRQIAVRSVVDERRIRERRGRSAASPSKRR